MRLEISTFLQDRILAQTVVEQEEGQSFVKTLEKALISACREVNAPLPLWMERNTKEMAAFYQTIFFAEQFLEKISFDRLQIRLLEF